MSTESRSAWIAGIRELIESEIAEANTRTTAILAELGRLDVPATSYPVLFQADLSKACASYPDQRGLLRRAPGRAEEGPRDPVSPPKSDPAGGAGRTGEAREPVGETPLPPPACAACLELRQEHDQEARRLSAAVHPGDGRPLYPRDLLEELLRLDWRARLAEDREHYGGPACVLQRAREPFRAGRRAREYAASQLERVGGDQHKARLRGWRAGAARAGRRDTRTRSRIAKCWRGSRVLVEADPVTGAREERVEGYCGARECPWCADRPWRRHRRRQYEAMGQQDAVRYLVATIPTRDRKRLAPGTEARRDATKAVAQALERFLVERSGVLPPIVMSWHETSEEAARAAWKANRPIPCTPHLNIVIGCHGLRAAWWRDPGRRKYSVKTEPGRLPLVLEDPTEDPGRPLGWIGPETLEDLKACIFQALEIPQRRRGRKQWNLWTSYRRGVAQVAHCLRYVLRPAGERQLVAKEAGAGAPPWAVAQLEARIAEARARWTVPRVHLVRPAGAIAGGRGGATRRDQWSRSAPIDLGDRETAAAYRTLSHAVGEHDLEPELVEVRTLAGAVLHRGQAHGRPVKAIPRNLPRRDSPVLAELLDHHTQAPDTLEIGDPMKEALQMFGLWKPPPDEQAPWDLTTGRTGDAQ